MLNAESVAQKFEYCLSTSSDLTASVEAEGILIKASFSPDRLKECSQFIVECLSHLSTNFYASEGGGWTFLNMCSTIDDKLWTDQHYVCDQLLTLAVGARLADVMLREVSEALPGGVPYVVFYV